MGILINNKYYKNQEDAPEFKTANIGNQIYQYDLDAQGQKHDMDLIQPYNPDGSKNKDFAKYYPELAKDYNMEELL